MLSQIPIGAESLSGVVRSVKGVLLITRGVSPAVLLPLGSWMEMPSPGGAARGRSRREGESVLNHHSENATQDLAIWKLCPLCAGHLKKLLFPASLPMPVCECVLGYDFAYKLRRVWI